MSGIRVTTKLENVSIQLEDNRAADHEEDGRSSRTLLLLYLLQAQQRPAASSATGTGSSSNTNTYTNDLQILNSNYTSNVAINMVQRARLIRRFEDDDDDTSNPDRQQRSASAVLEFFNPSTNRVSRSFPVPAKWRNEVGGIVNEYNEQARLLEAIIEAEDDKNTLL